MRQLRVLYSWLHDFEGLVQIVLIERKTETRTGIEEVATALGVDYSGDLETDAAGQDRLDSFMAIGERAAKADTIMFINSDIFLGPGFVKLLKELLQRPECQEKPFLISGIRYVFPMDDELEFNPFVQSVEDYAQKHIYGDGPKRFANLRPDMLDFFIFKPHTYKVIPPFRIGKSAWDNWLFAEALRLGFNTISGGWSPPILYCIHPEHDRPHQFLGAEQRNPGEHNRKLGVRHGGYSNGFLSNAAYELETCSDPKHSLCIKKKEVNNSTD
jgi:hypothetical protein